MWEAARAEFNSSLEEAEAESQRLGFLAADEVHAEMSGIIDKHAAPCGYPGAAAVASRWMRAVAKKPCGELLSSVGSYNGRLG